MSEAEAGTGAEPIIEAGAEAGAGAEEVIVDKYAEAATKGGWRPEAEYEGAEGSWVSAEEFVKRAPLFDKIKGQSKELREMRKTVEAMSKQFTKNVEATVKTQMAALKAEKREAIETGDVDKVESIEKEMDAVKSEAPAKDTTPPEVDDFLAKNKWYAEPGNEKMTSWANAYNKSLLADDPDMQAALDETSRMAKLKFPEKFENPRKQAAPTVEGQGQPAETGTGKTKYVMSRLSKDQKEVYNQIVKRNKVMEHDEYFKSLDEIGELA